MLRARCSNGMFILGLDAENLRRLQAGQPIVVALAQMGGTDDVMIMYGDTIEEIRDYLEEETGRALPPAIDVPKPS